MSNNKINILVTAICILVFKNSLFSQTKQWQTETTEDGKITVKYAISERSGKEGEEEQLVEYVAFTTARASMNDLISIFQDVSRHKEFMGQKTSSKLKTISENESIIYYFYKGVWPYPSSDIVAKMNFTENTINKTAAFTLTAAPFLFEGRNVKRLDYYNITYTFKDLGNDNTEITISAKFTPAVQLPDFLTKSWFPDGPAAYLSGIIKLANYKK